MRKLVISLGVALLLISPAPVLLHALSRNLQSLASPIVPSAPSLALLGRDCECPKADEKQQLDANEASLDPLERGRRLFFAGAYEPAISVLMSARSTSDRPEIVDFFLGASYICMEEGKKAASYLGGEELAWQAFKTVRQCFLVNDPARAGTLYDFALASKPDIWNGWHLDTNPDLLVWVRYYASQVAHNRDLPGTEEHWLGLALAESPHSPFPNYWWGILQKDTGNLEEAQRYLELAVGYARDGDLQFHPHLIRLYLGMSQWDKAVQMIDAYLTGEDPELETRWRSVETMVNRYRGSVLCDRIEPLLDQHRQSVSAGVAAIMMRITDGCDLGE